MSTLLNKVPKNMYPNTKHCRTVVETIAKWHAHIANCYKKPQAKTLNKSIKWNTFLMSSGKIRQIQFLKNWLCPYLEKGWISFFSVSMQLTKLGRTKYVQEFHNWVYAIGKVILVPVKLSSLSGLWARNRICSRYWLLAWIFITVIPDLVS